LALAPLSLGGRGFFGKQSCFRNPASHTRRPSPRSTSANSTGVIRDHCGVLGLVLVIILILLLLGHIPYGF